MATPLVAEASELVAILSAIKEKNAESNDERALRILCQRGQKR
jgi:hypothetical protein